MKQTFNSYYKPWLITSILIVGMASLSGLLNAESPRYNRIIPSMIVGTILLTAFCGGIYHFFYVYVKPRRIRKLIKRPRLEYLIDLGFEFDAENSVYSGQYKSFYITIGADTNAQTGDSIILNAFITPTENQEDLLTELQKKYELYFNDGYCWLTYRIGFLFNTPKRHKLERKLNQLIDDIRFKNIKPTQIEEESDQKNTDINSYE